MLSDIVCSPCHAQQTLHMSCMLTDVQHNLGGMGRRGSQWILVDRGELTGIIKPVLVNTWEVKLIATDASGGFRPSAGDAVLFTSLGISEMLLPQREYSHQIEDRRRRTRGKSRPSVRRFEAKSWWSS